MALKTAVRKPKVQRGISISPELSNAIHDIAGKLGKTWNEIAEAALVTAFLPDLSKRAETMSKSHDDVVEMAP